MCHELCQSFLLIICILYQQPYRMGDYYYYYFMQMKKLTGRGVRCLDKDHPKISESIYSSVDVFHRLLAENNEIILLILFFFQLTFFVYLDICSFLKIIITEIFIMNKHFVRLFIHVALFSLNFYLAWKDSDQFRALNK